MKTDYEKELESYAYHETAHLIIALLFDSINVEAITLDENHPKLKPYGHKAGIIPVPKKSRTILDTYNKILCYLAGYWGDLIYSKGHPNMIPSYYYAYEESFKMWNAHFKNSQYAGDLKWINRELEVLQEKKINHKENSYICHGNNLIYTIFSDNAILSSFEIMIQHLMGAPNYTLSINEVETILQKTEFYKRRSDWKADLISTQKDFLAQGFPAIKRIDYFLRKCIGIRDQDHLFLIETLHI